MIIYNDHLRLALAYAVRALREEEAKIGPDFCSTNRHVLEEALERMNRGEIVEVHQR